MFNVTIIKNASLILVFAGIACLRLYYCTELPVNTGDIPRHIYYGLYADKMGLSAAGHSLKELNPSLSAIAWSSLPYNYPITALLFFMTIVKLSPTIFFAKLMLTLIEAVNSWLIFKYSRQRILALLYWVSPISIWWVSHEAQFEPLQSLFVLSALVLLKKRKYPAFFLLALAIQVKISAVLFVPFFTVGMKQCKPKEILLSIIAFIIGFIPTAYAMFFYPILTQVYSTVGTLHFNPYHWNIFNSKIFNWTPWWLIVINQCATYGMLSLLIIWAKKVKQIRGFFASAGYIILCKINSLCQSWYFILQTSFLLTIEDKRKRLLLFALAPLLDITSLIQIIAGPFGYTVGRYYESVTAFFKHTI